MFKQVLMKGTLIISIWVLLITLLVQHTACTKHNKEDVLGICDTSNVTYSQDVAQLMSTHCNSCHGGTSPSFNISTENYTELKKIVDNGTLWGSINHHAGFFQMPKSSAKLNACDIEKIGAWIHAGALNN
ncbi:MAG: cytochrome c [Chitinophagaceae bacterium]